MSKREDLQKLTNSHGKITIAALDHRGSLKKSLHPDNPEITTDAEILSWKKEMVSLYENEVAGILIDPIFGKEIIKSNEARNGWMLSMEKTGYGGGDQERVTEILPDWSVKKAKEMGANGVKLLLYYDPNNAELAAKQKDTARRIAQECIEEDIVFLLEPLSYKVVGEKSLHVLKIVEDLKDLPVDIFKFEYPGTREACEKISSMIRVPWVLLSAGMEYIKYKEALKVAMESGASGFAVGRAVWQEFGDYAPGDERTRFLRNISVLRMRELVEIVNNQDKGLTLEDNQIKTIDQVDVSGKRIIVRVDWNVTIGKALQIVDDTRIVRTLPTIKWLLEHGAKQVVLLSHLGKAVEKRSLKPVVDYASKLMGESIELKNTIDNCQRDTVSRVMMLENVRLWGGEESNDPEFARELAGLGDIYVNEAFGESHRESASMVGIPKYLPSYGGFWLKDEVETILKVRNNPERPFVVVMGGAKVEDKIKLLEILSHQADTILLGGKLANEYVQKNMQVSGRAKIIVPIEGSDLLDIGLETQDLYASEIAKAKTVVWNGPMGKVEEDRYRSGTQAIYEALVANVRAYTLVGGGDTLASIGKEEDLERIDHVSTGGGAMLKLLEKGNLVGVDEVVS